MTRRPVSSRLSHDLACLLTISDPKVREEAIAARMAMCSNPPEESCSDAGCPVHGEDDD